MPGFHCDPGPVSDDGALARFWHPSGRTEDNHYTPDYQQPESRPETISGTIWTIATFLLPLALAAMALYLGIATFV
jgi:hypothetical protein